MASEILKNINGICHWSEEELLIRSVGRRLDLSRDNGDSFVPLCFLDYGIIKSLSSYFKLGSRLLRTNVKHCIKVRDDLLVIFAAKKIFQVNLNDGRVREVNIIHGSRPLNVCFDGEHLYYGEYHRNPERAPMNIYKSSDFGSTWTICYTFDNIRHIHGVFHDPVTEGIWVTTGDFEDEAGIWRTSKSFEKMEPVVRGGQQARVIDLLFTDTQLVYGTDAPEEQNWYYSMERSTLIPEKLAQACGPVFHAVKSGDDLYFSTVCEPSESTHYLNSELVKVSNGKVETILSREKDKYSMKYFQYGQLLLPSGRGNSGQIWCTPYALQGDQRSVLISTHNDV